MESIGYSDIIMLKSCIEVLAITITMVIIIIMGGYVMGKVKEIKQDVVCERVVLPIDTPERYWIITFWCIREECAYWRKGTWWRKGRCMKINRP